MATRRLTPEEETRLRQLARDEEERLAQELREHRDDPDEWDEEPAEFLVSANPGVVYSIRLTGAEFREISELARRKGLTIDELIKTTLLKREKPEKAGAPPKRSRKVRA